MLTDSFTPGALRTSDDDRPAPTSSPEAAPSPSGAGCRDTSEVRGSSGMRPVVIEEPLLTAMIGWNDDMLFAWFTQQPAAQAALSERERLRIVEMLEKGAAECATPPSMASLEARRHRRTRGPGVETLRAVAEYIRQCLVAGDHQAQRAREGLEVGARILLGDSLCTVVGKYADWVTLRGPKGGAITLYPPLRVREGATWTAYHGGIAARRSKRVDYRRRTSLAFDPI